MNEHLEFYVCRPAGLMVWEEVDRRVGGRAGGRVGGKTSLIYDKWLLVKLSLCAKYVII